MVPQGERRWELETESTEEEGVRGGEVRHVQVKNRVGKNHTSVRGCVGLQIGIWGDPRGGG